MHGLTRLSYQRALARRRLTRQEAEPEGMEPEHIQGGSNRIRIAIIAVVIIIVVGVTAALFLQSPAASGLAISLNSAKVTSANSAEVDLAVVLTIHNNTNKNLTYYGANWAISENGNSLDQGIWKDHYVLPPGATRTLNETIMIGLGDVVQVVPVSSAGSWRLQGTAILSSTPGTNSTQGFDVNFVTE